MGLGELYLFDDLGLVGDTLVLSVRIEPPDFVNVLSAVATTVCHEDAGLSGLDLN
jgi:hypothetical protein